MYFTRETDYAIRITLCLATMERRVDAKYISEYTDVTLRFALKILRKLVGGGLVKSFKGAQGGYEINRDPADISIADVVRVFEGDFEISKCLRENQPPCKNAVTGKYCKVQKEFNRISGMIQNELSALKIASFIDKEDRASTAETAAR